MTKPLNLNKILIVFSLFTFANGQSDYSFRNISVRDGLAESTVKVIYEDVNGLMYLGTENGLDVYDGYEFYNYHMNSFDDNSILYNFCVSYFRYTMIYWFSPKNQFVFYWFYS